MTRIPEELREQAALKELQALHIHINGIVQGVGFRPFVYALAQRLSLTGWVRNTSAGVDIRVEGDPLALDQFVYSLRDEAPPLSTIDDISHSAVPSNGFERFEIVHSESITDAFQPISPDTSICDDCLKELFDPSDRRFLYPFTNCTNCGPRFTIIEDIPYDRPNTTMSVFPLCPECQHEYGDPLDRRFHAQPVACPTCGPSVWLEPSPPVANSVSPYRTPEHAGNSSEAIGAAQQLLSQGKTIAIKGLGGFHLACDAENPGAVARLRERKLRVDKPFALMMPDVKTVQAHCELSVEERDLLLSRQRPIVILKRKSGSTVAAAVAPGQTTLGVMLPYTPLHYLLFAGPEVLLGKSEQTFSPSPKILVMTSGNLSEEPIAVENEEARERLSGLADAFLMHNRPIRTRCDDSVLRVFSHPDFSGQDKVHPEFTSNETVKHLPEILTSPIRRSRGYAPFPVYLPWKSLPLLAVGAELKNTFCLTRDRYAFLSHHIGDLSNFETLQSFEDGVAHIERLFRVEPQAIAHDLHPDYLSTRYAVERSDRDRIPCISIQHHHAHIAACMAENDVSGDVPVLGVSLDGTGYGEDGAIWGGEFLIADYQRFLRFAHLKYAPLPGGDLAVQQPWRMALSWLHTAEIAWETDLPPVHFVSADENPSDRRHSFEIDYLHLLANQIHTATNSPLTSSFGRLFDAVAALLGIRCIVNYEAQAAIDLESVADPGETGRYQFAIHPSGPNSPCLIIDPAPLLIDMIADLRNNVPIPSISTRFHRAVSDVVVETLMAMRKSSDSNDIALSGGVWQNQLLLHLTVPSLLRAGFNVHLHTKVPCNDGGVALGQAAIASQSFMSR